MFELIIFILVILLRFNSFYYYFYYRKQLDNFKDIGNLIIFTPFTRYTDSSIFLTLIWGYNALFYKPIPELTCTTWCILCNVSIGYWLFKKRLITNEPNSDTIFYKFTEFMSHGGIPILMVFDYVNIHTIFKI